MKCMKASAAIFVAALFPLIVSANQARAAETLKMVPFHQVVMDDVIWRPRIRKLVQDTLPHAFTNTEVAQRRLRMCAEYLENKGGPKPEPHRFNTSDLYKVMEGAALMIRSEPNPQIEATMDRVIDIIARAQQDDGYLYVSHICGNPIVGEMGPRPYSYVIHSHELYNMGHLYEAAVAYAQATGKTKLLEIAEKSAAHINKAFFEGDPRYNDGKPVNQGPGHEEIEIGLVKLYNYTGKRLYLDMAKRFLDVRGVTFVPRGRGVNSPTYAQQHAPVARQTEAVGHAVRATYLYAAMAEVDSLLGTDDYSQALDAIWHNLVDTKMHITGGLGAVHGIEGFGPSYVLPNKDTYLETCAAVGNVFFNMRMFLKYGDAKYVDVAEIALLNNCLSGIGLDGKSFFYPNPLEADYGHKPRSGWFGCACCPSNIARLIPQVSGYMYAVEGSQLYCALYGANSTSLEIDGHKVDVRQHTDYPCSGDIEIQLDPESPTRFTLNVRIPTWAHRQLVPGQLYAYTQPSDTWRLEVNGTDIKPAVSKGFAVIERTWKPDDRVTLHLPMAIKVNTCIDKVEANRDRVALSRGPLFYCAEGIDNGGAVQRFIIDPDSAAARATTAKIEKGALAGLTQVTVPARELKAENKLVDTQIRLIPYFAWSNRDRSSMITWMPTRPELAQLDPRRPENMKFAGVKASHTFANDTTDAIRMRSNPKSSFDNSIPRWTSWPQRGKRQWVEIDLGKVQEVRSIAVYWYDDKGGVQCPGSWTVQVPDGGGWKTLTIYNTDQYSTLADDYNTVHPAEPLKTDRFRIVMEPKHDRTCVGILSVDVEGQSKETK